MKSTIWLSYDLGVNGDYEGMYSWLDTQGAKECGTSVAYLTYTHSGNLMESLKSEICDIVSLDKRSRVYVVRRDGQKIKGGYLVGRRRGAPWEGYGEVDTEPEDSE